MLRLKLKTLQEKLYSRIFWKLITINLLVIGSVIWLTGVSVNDFACFLVNQFNMVGEARKEFFNSTMEYYLIRTSIIAVIVAAVLHYYLTRKVVAPLQKLVQSTKKLSSGQYPQLLEAASKDEIGELTKNFNQLIIRLKKMEEAKKNMINDMAHELRTPLTNLNGYLEGLSQGVLKGDESLFQSLYEESVRLTRMVNQLDQLTEWEYKHLHHFELKDKVDIKPFIEECVKLFQLDLEQRGISYIVCIEEAQVLVDRDGLKQVMNNLIQNAIQYKIGDGDICIYGREEEGMYKVTVQGEGEPIPEEKREWLFERFYRVDSARSRNTGGTGLGLSIVKKIIERHMGEVGMYSEGNTHSFWFTIPLASRKLDSSN